MKWKLILISYVKEMILLPYFNTLVRCIDTNRTKYQDLDFLTSGYIIICERIAKAIARLQRNSGTSYIAAIESKNAIRTMFMVHMTNSFKVNTRLEKQ